MSQVPRCAGDAVRVHSRPMLPPTGPVAHELRRTRREGRDNFDPLRLSRVVLKVRCVLPSEDTLKKRTFWVRHPPADRGSRESKSDSRPRYSEPHTLPNFENCPRRLRAMSPPPAHCCRIGERLRQDGALSSQSGQETGADEKRWARWAKRLKSAQAKAGGALVLAYVFPTYI